MFAPPTNLRRFLERHLGIIDHLLKDIEAVREDIRTLGNDDNQRMLAHWLRYADEDADYHLVHSADHFANYRLNRFELNWLRDSLHSPIVHGTSFLRFIPQAAKSGHPLSASETGFFRLLERADEGARSYGFDPEDPATKSDPDFQGAKALCSALQRLFAIYETIHDLQTEIAGHIDATLEVHNSLDPHKWRPEHKPVETLWHATIFADEIAQEGFLSRKPKDRKGLGNFGNQETISLTVERETAESIVDCFLDVWDIGNGLVHPADILQLIREEQLDIDLRPHSGLIDETTLRSPLDAMKLYRLYLAYTTTRINPVFVNPDELLDAVSKIPRESIGLVACETRLDEKAEFVLGEAEFRVTVDHVISVRRLAHERSSTPLSKPTATSLTIA